MIAWLGHPRHSIDSLEMVYVDLKSIMSDVSIIVSQQGTATCIHLHGIVAKDVPCRSIAADLLG